MIKRKQRKNYIANELFPDKNKYFVDTEVDLGLDMHLISDN